MAKKSAVQKKTAHLIHEGKKPAQAYATAKSMERAGRLTPSGGYKPVQKRSMRKKK